MLDYTFRLILLSLDEGLLCPGSYQDEETKEQDARASTSPAAARLEAADLVGSGKGAVVL